MIPSIRFTATPAGRVAFATLGRGPALVCDTGWIGHLQESWRHPAYREFFESLARTHTVIRYDKPGTGLSERERDTTTWQPEVAAIGAIADQLDLDQMSIFGVSQGAVIALMYAAEQPTRVSRLLLYGGYAVGSALASEQVRESLLGVVLAHWGLGSRTLSDVFAAGADAETLEWFAQLQRMSASPEMAASLLALNYRTDVRPVLPRVLQPALVLHRDKDRGVPFEAGTQLASLLPNALFKPLEGAAHLPYIGDSKSILNQISEFLLAGSGNRDTTPAGLSERELEVARLIAEGLTNAQIAKAIQVARRTADSHVEHIRNKLGVRSRTQIAAWFINRSM